MERDSNVRLTIITPHYNQFDTVERTILSVLNQTLKEIEYIVVDDGSTDIGIEVIKQYDDRLVFIEQNNIGQVKTLNKYWELAKGEYITYLSADDTLHPQCCEILVNYLDKESSQTVLVFPQNHLIDSNNNIIKHNVSRSFDAEECILKSQLNIGVGAIFRKTYFDLNGGWDERYLIGPDREYYIRMGLRYKLALVPEALAYYRYHEKSGVNYIKGFKKTLEYVYFLDRFFENNRMNSAFVMMSYSNAYLLVAINALRAWELKAGLKFYIKSIMTNPRQLSPLNILSFIRRVISRPIRLLFNRLRS